MTSDAELIKVLEKQAAHAWANSRAAWEGRTKADQKMIRATWARDAKRFEARIAALKAAQVLGCYGKR